MQWQIFWIGCCDARASEAKALPGKEIFVHRNIGKCVYCSILTYQNLTIGSSQFQFTDSNAIASLSYAVSLSTMEEIRVVGHTDCGGIHACHDAAHGRPPPLHWALWNWLEALSVTAKAHPHLTVRQLTELNVRLQVQNVRAVLEKLTNRPLRVGGYVYDLAKNRLDPVQ